MAIVSHILKLKALVLLPPVSSFSFACIYLLVFRREFLELGGLHVLLYLGECLFRNVFEHVADTLESGAPVYVQGEVLGIGLTDGSITLLFELADLPPLFLRRAVALVHLAYLLGVFLGDGVFLLLERTILAQVVHHGLELVLQGFLVDFLQTLALFLLCQTKPFRKGFALLLREISTLRIAPLGLLRLYLGFLFLVVELYLPDSLGTALSHLVDAFLLVLLTEPRKFLGPLLLGRLLALQFFLQVLVSVATSRLVFGPGMAADIAVLAYLAHFLCQVLRLFEQVVTEFLGIGDGLLLVLLILFLDDGRRVYLAVALSLRKIEERLLEPPHGAIDIICIGRLQLVHLVVGFHGLVDQCLCLGLQEEHLDIVGRFLREDIVPLGNGVIVAESLAVLAVQFLGLLLFLLLAAGELLQLANGVVYLETGLYHLRPALALHLNELLRLLPCLLLRIAVFVEQDYQAGDDGGQTQREGRHERRRHCGGDAEGCRQPCVGRRQQVLHLHHRHQSECGVFVQGVEHLLQTHRDGHDGLHPRLYLGKVLVFGGEQGHGTGGGGEHAGQTADAGHEALQVGIIVGEYLGLGMEVGDGIGQQGCLLRHLAVLFRVLLPFQTHLGHRVLQLAQLHGQTLVALSVFLLLTCEAGEYQLLFLQRFLGGVEFGKGCGLGVTGGCVLVGFLQLLDTGRGVLHQVLALGDTLGKGLLRHSRRSAGLGELAVLLL